MISLCDRPATTNPPVRPLSVSEIPTPILNPPPTHAPVTKPSATQPATIPPGAASTVAATGAVVPPLAASELPIIGGPFIPAGLAGEVDVDCRDDAVLVDGNVCVLISAAAEVNAQSQRNTGVQARSLVNPNVCAASAALGSASGTCAAGGDDGLIDTDVCAPLGVLGSASTCAPMSGFGTRMLVRTPLRRNQWSPEGAAGRAYLRAGTVAHRED